MKNLEQQLAEILKAKSLTPTDEERMFLDEFRRFRDDVTVWHGSTVHRGWIVKLHQECDDRWLWRIESPAEQFNTGMPFEEDYSGSQDEAIADGKQAVDKILSRIARDEYLTQYTDEHRDKFGSVSYSELSDGIKAVIDAQFAEAA